MVNLPAIWDRLLQDVRYGWRMLMARPGFSLVALVSIALGIGATTAIFSVVYAVLVDPYPYRAAERIGWLGTPNLRNGGLWQFNYSPAQYLELKSRAHTMEEEIAVVGHDAVLGGKDLLPEVVRQEDCSTNFFDFFGVPALVGRAFSTRDFAAGQEPDRVAVIGYKFWQHAFQGSRDVLGRKILLTDKEFTIIGVLPVRFTWNDVDVYTPMSVRPGVQDYVDIYYRVRPGVSGQQVAAEFYPLMLTFRKQVPRYFYLDGPIRPEWVTIRDAILGKFAATLLALFGAVFLLLLIACGNVANLLLARAATREGEMAIRVSIGATRLRLVRQLLTESVVLALIGGILGVGLAFLGVKGVLALMPRHAIPHEAAIALNWPVLWFAAGLSVLTGIIFGVAPAVQVSGATHAQALKSSSKGSGTSGGGRRVHDLLMVFEITLSLLLLTGAGLAVKGLVVLLEQPLGFDPSHVLTFRIPIGEDRYTQWATQKNYYEQLLDRFSRAPGVEAAGMSESGTPPYNGFNTKIMFDDRPASDAVSSRLNMVSGDYFRTLQVALLRGRWFNRDDMARARPIAVISHDLAVRAFGERSPIGRHLHVDLFNQPLPRQMMTSPTYVNSFEIVGVVGTMKNRGLEEADPAVFIPYTLVCTPYPAMFIRTRGDPLAFVRQARETVKSVDPHTPIMAERRLREWVDSGTRYPRFATFLFGVFGGIGMLLAATGVFSVVSYAVAHRTREFGLRMALGATPGDVLRLVLGSTMRVLATGLAIGLLLSMFAARALANQMAGMGTADASLFVGVPAVLIAATLLACLMPARAATHIEPMEALRQE